MNVVESSGHHLSQQTGSPPPQGDRRKLYLYLVPFILLPILLFLLALAIVPTQWFSERAGNSYLANIGYGTKLHNVHCDVVIYGDSSAMMGVDPAIVKARTGLKTCNIAEFEAITLVDHMSIVDIFLRNNPRPKYLIFLYVPDDLTLAKKWSGISTFEAITFNLQSNRTPRTMGLLVTHPKETLGWSELGLRMLAQHFRSRPSPAEVIHQREADRGLFRYTETVETRCTKWKQDAVPDPAWLASLRATYGVGGTKVLIDATPTADCDPSLPFYREYVEPVIDNRPYPTLPITDFQDNGHLHANSRGRQAISEMIADQLNSELRKQPEKNKETAMLQGGR